MCVLQPLGKYAGKVSIITNVVSAHLLSANVDTHADEIMSTDRSHKNERSLLLCTIQLDD